MQYEASNPSIAQSLAAYTPRMREGTDSKKIQARDKYRRFVEARFQTALGNLNYKQRSEGLGAFYIEEIYNRLHTPISDEDFEDGWVDNAGDLEVDFITKDDDTVLILQAKYAGEGKVVDPKDISHFQSILQRLQNGDFKPNPRLAEALRSVDFLRDNFVLKFVTLAALEGDAKRQADSRPELPASIADRVDFEYMDVSRLTEELRHALPGTAGLRAEFTFAAAGRRGSRAPIIELQGVEHPCCVLVVSGQQLVNLYRQFHRDELFSLNIRNFLGNSITNRNIAKTLREEPQNFYFYNNGISCLATFFEVNDDRVVTRGLQVINGAQTVRSLAKMKPNELEGVLVMVRITEGGKDYGAEGRFKNNIVRWNNTQNVIKAADFRSNDPVQHDLKERFNANRRPDGHPIVYVPKRTDSAGRLAAELIPIEEFAKVVHSFLFDPISFSARTSYLFDDDPAKGGYARVFGDGKDVWVTMPEADFKLRSALWWISRDFNREIQLDRKRTQDPLTRAALERKWFLLFVAGLVLERSFGEGWRRDVARLHRGDWKFAEDATGQWIKMLYDISKEVLLWMYTDAARKPGFIHRNWMRSTDTVTAFRTYTSTAPIRTMPSLPRS
jgi:hypothetical protein